MGPATLAGCGETLFLVGARIVAVANTLDSITTDLPYRAAAPFRVALAEIQRCSGSQFDPQVVKVFLNMPENIWEDLRKKIGSQYSTPSAANPTAFRVIGFRDLKLTVNTDPTRGAILHSDKKKLKLRERSAADVRGFPVDAAWTELLFRILSKARR